MISDFKSGQKFVDFFVLRHKEMRTKRDSSECYLSLELGDASGRIFGSLWNDVIAMNESLHEGQIIKVRGVVIDWHGKAHLSVDKIRAVKETDDINLDNFLPHSNESPEILVKRLVKFIKDVDDPFLKQLLHNIFKDTEITKPLEKTPGGKLWHHCYTGGLLEHTIMVVNACKTTAAAYERINKSLLITGAMLHDIGKIVEYSANGFFEYSDEGRLHGHISIGFHLVAARIEKIEGFPDELKKELLHLILSHQGSKENGSPVAPMTREALILSSADELDAKLGAFDRIYAREYEPGKKWSNYVNLMDRFFYFGQKKA
jgi:3'-5' exoribonuclease